MTEKMSDEEKSLFWELVYWANRDKKGCNITTTSLQPVEQYLHNIMMKMLEPKPLD